jgi:hypothetical protein
VLASDHVIADERKIVTDVSASTWRATSCRRWSS